MNWDDEYDDIKLGRLVEDLLKDEELDLKQECMRCGSRIWAGAKFLQGEVVKCTDCPSDFEMNH